MTEVVVYHVYNKAKKIHKVHTPKPKKGKIEAFLLKLSKFFAIVGIILVFYSYGPSLYFWIQSGFGQAISNFTLSKAEVSHLQVKPKTVKNIKLPPFDPKLSTTNHLAIPSIGVDTDLEEATYDNYEEALKKGVWRVSNFGSPNQSGTPVILAAHRFGYLAWSNLYRHKNSFFNLPKVKVGDIVQITWRQRKYIYEIYFLDKGAEITDYSADVILYTCEALTGPNRIFVYAKLIQI